MVASTPQLQPLTRAKSELFRSPEKYGALISLLLVLLTLIVYNPAAHNGFVALDDPEYVTGNPHVQSGVSWRTVEWAFTSTEAANWHPLTWLSHALDCQLFHGRAAGHHYISVLLHAICVLLLFAFLAWTTKFPWRSALVAALFAIHPINVEAVAWISERKSVLSMLFFALALLAYCWYTQHPGLKRYGLLMSLFACSLMSKPMAVTLPFVLLLLDYWPLERDKQTSWGRLLLEKVPLLVLSAASAVVTIIAQKAGGAIHGKYSFGDRLFNAVVAYALYLEKAVWPSHLAAFYPHPQHIPAWKVIISLTVLVGITIAVFAGKKHRFLAVGWLWFLGTLVPVIGLVQVGEQAMADRYAYIPFIGLFIAVVWGIGELAGGRRSLRLYAASAACLAIVGLSLVTHVQIGYWKDNVTLWAHALAVTENNAMAHESMGAELIAAGRIPEAMVQLQEASAIDPNDAFSQLDLGICEKLLGHIKTAEDYYQNALRLSNDASLKASAWGNLGGVYRISGDYDRARASYEAALGLLPGNKYALIGLGLISQKTGDLAHAADFYSKAVQSDPSDAEYLLLSQALAKAGRQEAAQMALVKAHQMSTNWDATVLSVNHLLQE